MPFSEALDLVYPNFHLSDDVRKIFTDLVAKEHSAKKRRSSPPSSVKVGVDQEASSKSNLILTPTFERAAETLCKALSVGESIENTEFRHNFSHVRKSRKI